MSLKELASLMKSALSASTVEPAVSTVEKKVRKRPISRSSVSRDEIRRIVQEEVRKAIEELRKSIIEELRKSTVDSTVDDIVERVLQRLEERKRKLQRERVRSVSVSEEEALRFLPLIQEYSRSKRKFRGSPRCFVPSEFQKWLREAKGQEYDLRYIRGVLQKLRRLGYLEKSSDSRYRLVVRQDEGL